VFWRLPYLGLNRFVAGKPFGASFPAPARLPSHSRHSGQARVRPSAVVQDASSEALTVAASRRPPFAVGLELDALASRHLGQFLRGEDQDLAVVADDGELVG